MLPLESLQGHMMATEFGQMNEIKEIPCLKSSLRSFPQAA